MIKRAIRVKISAVKMQSFFSLPRNVVPEYSRLGNCPVFLNQHLYDPAAKEFTLTDLIIPAFTDNNGLKQITQH